MFLPNQGVVEGLVVLKVAVVQKGSVVPKVLGKVDHKKRDPFPGRPVLVKRVREEVDQRSRVAKAVEVLDRCVVNRCVVIQCVVIQCVVIQCVVIQCVVIQCGDKVIAGKTSEDVVDLALAEILARAIIVGPCTQIEVGEALVVLAE